MRVESVSQTVAQEVDSGCGKYDSTCGEDEKMRSISQVFSGFGEHGASFGIGRLHTESEEAQG